VESAANWLCSAFGFQRAVDPTADDHRTGVCRLFCGDHLIMLLPVGGSEIDGLMRQPDEIGGAETQSCYVVVDDVEAHRARALAAGAQIAIELKDFDGGGRGYACRDMEGHLWTFGTFDPAEGLPARPETQPTARTRRGSALVIIVILLIVLGGSAAAFTYLLVRASAEQERLRLEAATATQRAAEAKDIGGHQSAALASERAAREAAEKAAEQAREQASRETTGREAAERSLREKESQLTDERRARAAAEQAASAAHDRAAQEQKSVQAAERGAAEAREELALARAVTLQAERAARESAEKLARERSAREAAERAARQIQARLEEAQSATPRQDKGAPRTAKGAAAQTPGRKRPASSPGPPEQPLPELIP
jgi:uncharacterized glyoxalase superfamily protein PhnB